MDSGLDSTANMNPMGNEHSDAAFETPTTANHNPVSIADLHAALLGFKAEMQGQIERLHTKVDNLQRAGAKRNSLSRDKLHAPDQRAILQTSFTPLNGGSDHSSSDNKSTNGDEVGQKKMEAFNVDSSHIKRRETGDIDIIHLNEEHGHHHHAADEDEEVDAIFKEITDKDLDVPFSTFLARRTNRKNHYDHTPYLNLQPNDPAPWWMHWRQEAYWVLHDEGHNNLAFSILMFVMFLILVSTVTYVLESVPVLQQYDTFWIGCELVVTVLFSIEYFSRLIIVRNRLWGYSEPTKEEQRLGKTKGKCSVFNGYVCKPMNMIDLLAILPFYLENFLNVPTEGLRVIRVVRLLRLARLRNLFSESTEIMQDALGNAFREAGPMIFAGITVIAILFGSLVFAFENGKAGQDGFVSIPESMWFVFVTMTTVGYGDMSPITPIGRTICIITMLTGIIFMSIVVIIIGGNFEASRNNFLKVKDRFDALRKERQIKTHGAMAKDKDSMTTTPYHDDGHVVSSDYARLDSGGTSTWDPDSPAFNDLNRRMESGGQNTNDPAYDLASPKQPKDTSGDGDAVVVVE